MINNKNMINNALNFIKKNLVYCILFLMILILGCTTAYYSNKVHNIKINAVVNDGKGGEYDVINSNKTLKDLKNEQKELYDSIKHLTDYNKINIVYQFKYEKEYVTDTIYCDTTNYDKINIYSYTNTNITDSIKYNLLIGANKEPNWYKLQVKVQDQFTIVNKKLDGDLNETTIKTDNGGTITDVTVINTNDKKTFWKHFNLGVSLTAGFDITTKKPSITIGPSITYSFK